MIATTQSVISARSGRLMGSGEAETLSGETIRVYNFSSQPIAIGVVVWIGQYKIGDWYVVSQDCG